MNKVIYRTCIVSRKKDDRETMFRVVKTPNHEINIDPTYLKKGRGAYLSKDKSIIEKGKKSHSLEKHLKVKDLSYIYDELIKLLD